MEHAVESCQDGQPDLKLRLLNGMGQLRRLNQALPGALEAHRAARALSATLGDPLAEAEAINHPGRAYVEGHQYADGEKQLPPVLAQVTSTGGRAQPLLARTFTTLGLIRRAHDELHAAVDYVERAAAIWSAQDDPGRLAKSLNDLGNTLCVAGKYEAALRCFDEAPPLLE